MPTHLRLMKHPIAQSDLQLLPKGGGKKSAQTINYNIKVETLDLNGLKTPTARARKLDTQGMSHMYFSRCKTVVLNW